MAEGKFPSVPKYLKEWTEILIRELRHSAVEQMQINKSKSKFTSYGDPQASPLVSGIRPIFNLFGTKVEAIIIMPSEWYWLEHGRSSGKMPPEEPIIKWIVHRGFPIPQLSKKRKQLISLQPKSERKKLRVLNMDKKRKQLAFLIRRRIGEFGTRETKFFSNIVTDKLINNLKHTMKEKFKKDLTIELLIAIK